MSGNPLSYIRTKNSLRKKEKIHVIQRAILEKVQSDIDVTKLRSNGLVDCELIGFCCACVEELCKPKYNIDKKQFVKDILQSIFGGMLTVDEITRIDAQIQYAFDNGLIKKVEFNYKARMLLWQWIKRKFL